MTNKKKKEKRTIPLRDAGEVIISLERPSKVLYDLAAKAEKELLGPPTTTISPLPPPTTKTDVSPKRDYTKVANSIARDAVPSGLFKGTSKATYDVLYLKTRGAINPTRSIKAVQSDVLIWANVSHNTLRAHLKHLQSVGLVKVHYKLGDNNGSEYKVFLPEEIDLTSYYLLPPPTTSLNMVGGTYQNLAVGGGGLMPENINENESLKTSFKDSNTNDDEKTAAFSAVIEKFDVVTRKLTGRGISKREADHWNNFADLIILELEVAARRTNGISSVPAFLTEVLRRQFFASRKQRPTFKTKKTKTDTFGKADSDSYEIKPLDEKGRELALEHLREFAEDDFLQDFKKWYTEEDWQWLITELGID